LSSRGLGPVLGQCRLVLPRLTCSPWAAVAAAVRMSEVVVAAVAFASRLSSRFRHQVKFRWLLVQEVPVP